MVKNSTIAFNEADAGNLSGVGNGGGVHGAAFLTLTAVAANLDSSSSPNYQPDCSGGVVAEGFSAIGVVNGCAVTWDGGVGNQNGTTSSPLDLGLLPLADNGGATATIALSLGSPLLDAGTQVCAGKSGDQRASTRVKQDGNNDGGFDNDPCDIGALEVYKAGCGVPPVTITEYTYTDTQDVRSKDQLTTVGNVTVADTGDVRFVSALGIALGKGFKVAALGRFSASIRDLVCP